MGSKLIEQRKRDNHDNNNNNQKKKKKKKKRGENSASIYSDCKIGEQKKREKEKSHRDKNATGNCFQREVGVPNLNDRRDTHARERQQIVSTGRCPDGNVTRRTNSRLHYTQAPLGT